MRDAPPTSRSTSRCSPLAPIAIVLIFALNPTPYISLSPPVGVSLRWFEKFFGSAEFMNALWLSLWVAGCVLVLDPGRRRPALALARGNLPARASTSSCRPMLPAILTGLALFQSYLLLAGLGA
jgi:putative spermidine/putrescine transport system permease protein